MEVERARWAGAEGVGAAGMGPAGPLVESTAGLAVVAASGAGWAVEAAAVRAGSGT